MNKWLYGYIALWFILLFLSRNVFAGLTINEIYPAPASGDYEWVELYNNGDDAIDLSIYSLNDLAGNSIKINSTTLPVNGFFIASASSVLNNSGDTLNLKNNLTGVVETISYPGGITTEKSYAKCPDGNGQWLSSMVVTKNASNSPACLTLTPTDNPTPIPSLNPTNEPTLTPTIEPTSTSYNNIYLSELMVNPPTGENEWVEIYNQNDFPVYLNHWLIDDLEGSGASPKIFSMVIDSNSYLTFEITNSMFNNEGDNVRLLDFTQSLKDSFEYANSEKGKSFARVNFDSDQFCLQTPTKNLPNNRCLNPTTITATIKLTSSPIPTMNQPKSVSPNPTVKAVFNVSDINTQPGSILGVNQEKIINKQQRGQTGNRLTTSVASLVSLTHSVLTIAFLFLKIKIHEAS